MRQSLPWNRTRPNWRRCALGLLCVGSSGCVPTPVQITCLAPAPPPALMEPAPPPGSFTARLDAILDRTSTTSPATQTR